MNLRVKTYYAKKASPGVVLHGKLFDGTKESASAIGGRLFFEEDGSPVLVGSISDGGGAEYRVGDVVGGRYSAGASWSAPDENYNVSCVVKGKREEVTGFVYDGSENHANLIAEMFKDKAVLLSGGALHAILVPGGGIGVFYKIFDGTPRLIQPGDFVAVAKKGERYVLSWHMPIDQFNQEYDGGDE